MKTKNESNQTSKTTTKTTSPDAATEHADILADGSVYFAATAADRDAPSPNDLIVVNLDPGAGALIAIASLPRIALFEAAIKDLAPSCAHAVGSVKRYARAAFHANYRFLHAATGEEFARLYGEVTRWRARGIAVLALAASFDIVDDSVVSKLREGQGYRDAVEDVGAAEDIIRAHWDKLEGKVPITADDLQTMRTLTVDFAAALAEREDRAAGISPSANDRQRAFTLLARAYDEIRRALTFIRWKEGDVDDIVPSLWVRPGGGRRYGSDIAKPADPATTSPVASPAAPTTTANPPTTVNPKEDGPKGTPFTA